MTTAISIIFASQGTTPAQREAYWLEPNALSVAAGRAPRFVSFTNVQNLVVVPVTDSLKRCFGTDIPQWL
jgi:hypothetical protein